MCHLRGTHPVRRERGPGCLRPANMRAGEHRKTPIEVKPVAFTPTFSASDTAQKLWLAFVRRGKLTNAPERFGEVVDSIGSFPSPVAASCLGDARLEESWTASGPWKKPRRA